MFRIPDAQNIGHIVGTLLPIAGFYMLAFFKNSTPVEFQVQYLALFRLSSVTDGFEWFWMESIHKNIQEYSSRLHVWSYTFLTIHQWLPNNVFCYITIFADYTTIYLSVIRHVLCANWFMHLVNGFVTVDLGRNWLLISMLEKSNLFPLTSLITPVWVWCWGYLFLLNKTGVFTNSLMLKLPPTKLKPRFVSCIFFFLGLLFISINLPCSLAWNTCLDWCSWLLLEYDR